MKIKPIAINADPLTFWAGQISELSTLSSLARILLASTLSSKFSEQKSKVGKTLYKDCVKLLCWNYFWSTTWEKLSMKSSKHQTKEYYVDIDSDTIQSFRGCVIIKLITLIFSLVKYKFYYKNCYKSIIIIWIFDWLHRYLRERRGEI